MDGWDSCVVDCGSDYSRATTPEEPRPALVVRTGGCHG